MKEKMKDILAIAIIVITVPSVIFYTYSMGGLELLAKIVALLLFIHILAWYLVFKNILK